MQEEFFFYLSVLLVGFSLLTWLIAVVAPYLDETPADFEVT